MSAVVGVSASADRNRKASARMLLSARQTGWPDLLIKRSQRGLRRVVGGTSLRWCQRCCHSGATRVMAGATAGLTRSSGRQETQKLSGPLSAVGGSRTMHTIRRLLLSTLALTALALVPSVALAVPPAQSVLTPPPPAFLTCRATRSGTICEGSRTITFGLEPNAPVCGTGADAFQIFVTSTLNQRAIRFSNEEGNLTKRIIHNHYRGEWSNPETGAVAPYIQNQNTTDVLAVPGDLGDVDADRHRPDCHALRSGCSRPVRCRPTGLQRRRRWSFSAGQHVFTSS